MSTFFIDEYNQTASTRSLERRHNILMGSSISAVVAGSDTTRGALIAVFYYLCKHPTYINNIREEIRTLDTSDVNALAMLPCLNAVIKETLRLAPPAMTGNSRITGPEGLWIEDTWIPGGTKVSVPNYIVHRRKCLFPRFSPNVAHLAAVSCAFADPDEFIPERWTSRPELIHDSRAYAPFSVGNTHL